MPTAAAFPHREQVRREARVYGFRRGPQRDFPLGHDLAKEEGSLIKGQAGCRAGQYPVT
jgi:hypothetical protein